MNTIYMLAERENADFINFKITALEINYLDKRKPWVAVMWSCFMPGLGQLYIHRVIATLCILVWTIAVVYFSHLAQGIHYLSLAQVSAVFDKNASKTAFYVVKRWQISILVLRIQM